MDTMPAREPRREQVSTGHNFPRWQLRQRHPYPNRERAADAVKLLPARRAPTPLDPTTRFRIRVRLVSADLAGPSRRKELRLQGPDQAHYLRQRLGILEREL